MHDGTDRAAQEMPGRALLLLNQHQQLPLPTLAVVGLVVILVALVIFAGRHLQDIINVPANKPRARHTSAEEVIEATRQWWPSTPHVCACVSRWAGAQDGWCSNGHNTHDSVENKYQGEWQCGGGQSACDADHRNRLQGQ